MIFTIANPTTRVVRLVALLCFVGALSLSSTSSYAADLLSTDSDAFVAPVAVASPGWQFHVTPYAWAAEVHLWTRAT